MRELRNLSVEPQAPQLKPPGSLVSVTLFDAWRAWRSLAGLRFAPARKDIQPTRFKPVLPDTFIFEVLGDGHDFRLVLGGDRIIRFLQNRLVPGMLLSETAGSVFHERVARAFRHCIRTRKPIATGPTPIVPQGGEGLAIEGLIAPLSEDGANVTGLFGAFSVAPVGKDQLPAMKLAAMATAFPVDEAVSQAR